MTAPTRPLIVGPGYEVTQPGGNRAWLAENGVVIVEDANAGVYRITAPDLSTPVLIDADEMRRAASQVPNLILARIHEARATRRDVCPWHPDSPEAEARRGDDPVEEVIAAMVAAALAATPRTLEGGRAWT